MKELYQLLGITKQGHWKAMLIQQRSQEDREILVQSMLAIRSLHPKMGARKMYQLIKPESIGRDAFIDVYTEAGLCVAREKSYRKTTYSLPCLKYKNLTEGLVIKNINHVWTSDITYFQLKGGEFVYIVFIIDVYSRRILGFNASENLRAESNIKALNMALKLRGETEYTSLIHHSDKGVQYTSKAYTSLLEKYRIKISMCDIVYENTHIERVNGIIKNEYLSNYPIKNITECRKILKKSVENYNVSRPHWSLDLKSPIDFENELLKIKIEQRKELKIYHDMTKKKNTDSRQVELFFYEKTSQK